ncbi:hypothetical protein N9C24_02020 [Gammaproteobacteria bacterium]|nr:hypothetical protein [Gammaproteobacteria bacterium]
MNNNPVRHYLSNTYRKSIIRFFDTTAPILGPLNDKKGVINIKKYYSEEQVMSMSSSSPANVKDILKRDSYLTDLFSDYLNKWNIDTCFMWETEEGENNSSIWHHDSVGHRIKIFIGVSEKSNNTGTLFVSDSYKNKYNDYLSTRVNKDFNENETFLINMDVGDLMIFDTNCIHAGLYGSKPRKAITVEISNPYKGFLLPGKIGKKDFRENESFS